MAEMRARFAQGGGPGAGALAGAWVEEAWVEEAGAGEAGAVNGGNRRKRRGPAPQRCTWPRRKRWRPAAIKPVLRPVTVKVGIGDATHSEVLEGLKEGDPVVTGAVASAASPANPVSNPFRSPFGGGGGGRPR